MRRIFLGAQCNNACIFCAQGELRRGRENSVENAAMERAIACVEPGETVALMGGEPTLFEALPAWIQALEKRGAARIVVQSNGRRLAYQNYADALKAASSKLSLEVSLHGSTAPMHDYHTQVPGSFQQSLLGLRNAQRAGIESVVSCVVTRSNYRHLREIVALTFSLGIRTLRFARALALGSAAQSKDRVVPAPELLKPYWAQAVLEAKRLGIGSLLFEQDDPAQRFAGLGEVQNQEPERETIKKAGRVSLALLDRPVPGKQEIRTVQRKSGEELRAILPALFETSEAAKERAG